MNQAEKNQRIRQVFNDTVDLFEDKSLEWQVQYTLDRLSEEGHRNLDHGDVMDALYETRDQD